MEPYIYLEDAADLAFHTGRNSELFFDPANGNIWQSSSDPRFANPDLSMDDALSLESDGRLIRLPKARDLHEVDIMDEYIDQVPERLMNRLEAILRQSNPFQAWRATLDQAGLLNDYNGFRQLRGADILEEWCQDHGIECRHKLVTGALNGEYMARQLREDDVPKIWNLMRKSDPKLSAAQIRTNLMQVPDGAVLDQKQVIGWFDQDELIAVCTVLVDHPQVGDATISQLYVKDEERWNGLGSRLLKSLEAGLATAGKSHLTALGDAPHFLEMNGYAPSAAGKYEKTQTTFEDEYEPEFDDVHEWTF